MIEFIKLYDIIWNFKSLVEKAIPNSVDFKAKEALKKLNELEVIRFNKNEKVTPQVVKMTLSADIILSEIRLLIDQLVDDLVLTKYESFNKENELLNLQKENYTFELKQISDNSETKNEIEKEFYNNEIK